MHSCRSHFLAPTWLVGGKARLLWDGFLHARVEVQPSMSTPALRHGRRIPRAPHAASRTGPAAVCAKSQIKFETQPEALEEDVVERAIIKRRGFNRRRGLRGY
jgi:hypothetical protein